jgi:hypothetical protein
MTALPRYPADIEAADDIHLMVVLWQSVGSRSDALDLADRNRKRSLPDPITITEKDTTHVAARPGAR